MFASSGPAGFDRWMMAVVAVVFVVWNDASAEAEDADPHEAVEHCRQLIRNCQLPDGLIRMRAASDSVRGVPYFANMTASAIGASGRLSTGLDLAYPHQRANLYAVMFLDEVPAGLWPRLAELCPTDTPVMSTRCYFAARRAGSEEELARLRRIVLDQAFSLRPDNCDVFEAALAILVLIDGDAL